MSKDHNTLPAVRVELDLSNDGPLALAEMFIELYTRLEDDSVGDIDIIWSLTPKDLVGTEYISTVSITLASTLDLLDIPTNPVAQSLDVAFPGISAEDSDRSAYYTAAARILVHHDYDMPYITNQFLTTNIVSSCPIQELRPAIMALVVRQQSPPPFPPWYVGITSGMLQAATRFCPRWLRTFIYYASKIKVNPWCTSALRATVWTITSVVRFWAEVYIATTTMDTDTVHWLCETFQTSRGGNDGILACSLERVLPSSHPALDRSTPPNPFLNHLVRLNFRRCSWNRAARGYFSPISCIVDNFSLLIAVWLVLEQYWLIPDLMESWWFSRGTRLFMAGGTWGFSFIVLSIRSSVRRSFPTFLVVVYWIPKLIRVLAHRTADYRTWPCFLLYRRYHRYLNHPIRRGQMEICACIIGSACIYVSYLMYSLFEDGPSQSVERTIGYAFYTTCTGLTMTFCALSAFLSPT